MVTDIQQFVDGLLNSNDKRAYQCLKQLENESALTSDVYPFFDSYLNHILGDKPIMARQCINVLPSIVKYKPDLKLDIESALQRANPTKYEESMQSLIRKDIQKALGDIQKL